MLDLFANLSAAELAAGGLGLWTASWVGLTGLAMGRARAAQRKTVSTEARPEPGRLRVHLIRPCAGVDAHLEHNLTSLLRARIPADVELRVTLCTGRVDDDATAVCERVAGFLRKRGVEAQAFNFALGPDVLNQKVGQLARASTMFEADVIANVDSDVDLSDFDFEALFGALRGAPQAEAHGERIGAVWAAPVEVSPQTAGDRASAALLSASLHAFTLVAALDPDSFVGKCFAVRSDALAATGGFAAYSGWLGEDMELCRRLGQAGYRCHRAPDLVASTASKRSMEQVLDRYARWFAVIKWQRPHLLASYPFLFFAALLLAPAWAGLAAVAAATGAQSVALAALATLVVVVGWRTLFAKQSIALSQHPRSAPQSAGALSRALLADLTIARAFVRCLRVREVVWRGRRLRMRRGGRLELVAAP